MGFAIQKLRRLTDEEMPYITKYINILISKSELNDQLKSWLLASVDKCNGQDIPIEKETVVNDLSGQQKIERVFELKLGKTPDCSQGMRVLEILRRVSDRITNLPPEIIGGGDTERKEKACRQKTDKKPYQHVIININNV